MPLHRRLPKRGFTNIFKTVYKLISLDDLNRFETGTIVDLQALVDKGLVKLGEVVKILANGDITKSLTVRIKKISHGAKEKIIIAGGTVEE